MNQLNTLTKWWKERVFYQIYMPSFCDGNGDGIGDFKGITSKLNYLKDLGIGAIWLTPFYKSPKVDNGYDISDYYSVDSNFGTMEDFDIFIKKAHALDIKVIIDIVINHTSDQHPWFIESRSSKDNPKRDWYIWEKEIPNNWESFFGESAWELDKQTNEYYYHGFAKEQVDLNWTNPKVKEAIFEMLDFWLQKGVDGFRLDVINFLSVNKEYTNNPINEDSSQEHIHDKNQHGIMSVIKELRKFIDQYPGKVLVGEIGADDLQTIYSYVGEDKLHTTFNFNLGSMKKWDWVEFKKQLTEMDVMYSTDYPTLFFGSHDMHRMASRFNLSNEGIKALATFQLTYRGIPFIYFGEEIGLKDYRCIALNDARDIQGIIAYNQTIHKGEQVALNELNIKGRDASRSIMRWDDTINFGFSESEPWIPFNRDELANVHEQQKQQDSILSHYKKLLHLRNSFKVFQYGQIQNLKIISDCIYFERVFKDEVAYVIISFGNTEKFNKLQLFLPKHKNSSRILEGKNYLVLVQNNIL